MDRVTHCFPTCMKCISSCIFQERATRHCFSFSPQSSQDTSSVSSALRGGGAPSLAPSICNVTLKGRQEGDGTLCEPSKVLVHFKAPARQHYYRGKREPLGQFNSKTSFFKNWIGPLTRVLFPIACKFNRSKSYKPFILSDSGNSVYNHNLHSSGRSTKKNFYVKH